MENNQHIAVTGLVRSMEGWGFPWAIVLRPRTRHNLGYLPHMQAPHPTYVPTCESGAVALHARDRKPNPVRIVLLFQYALDCDGLAALFKRTQDIQVLGQTTNRSDFFGLCGETMPDVVVLEIGIDFESAISLHSKITHECHDQRCLFLDNRVSLLRAKRVLQLTTASYFSKQCSFYDLCNGIRKLRMGHPTFDPLLASDFVFHPTEKRINAKGHASSILDLSEREIEVLRLIAEGNSVRRVAEILNLAPSTIDNHKSRLMKKLGLHKLADLTRLAVREGLVD